MIAYILVVRDRKEQAAHSLPSLQAQASECGGEVIVVDQDSGPDDADHYRRACRAGGSRYIRLDRGGPFNRSWTLNVGARTTDMPILAFCDADVVVGRGFAAAVVRKRREAFRDGPCFINCFPYKVDREPSDQFMKTGDMSILEAGDHWPWWTLGAGAHVDAASFRAIGGFDESYDGWGCEDDDIFQRMRAYGCGWACLAPIAKCWHLWHPTVPKKDDHEPPNRRRLARSVERIGLGDLVRNEGREWGSATWSPVEGDEDGN